MKRSDIEAVETAWRILDAQSCRRAKRAADAIVLFLEGLDDDGIVDRLNQGRSAKSLIADILASLVRKRAP